MRFELLDFFAGADTICSWSEGGVKRGFNAVAPFFYSDGIWLASKRVAAPRSNFDSDRSPARRVCLYIRANFCHSSPFF